MDQQKMRRLELSRKSVPYQIVKYILLLLNIMVVASTAIVTIIVCLLPTIIYEKKLSVESALSFFETGTLTQGKIDRSSSRSFEPQEADLGKLPTQEVETIRIIRYIILGLAGGIIINQTLAVYGLFCERSCYILLSSTFIGLVGQLSLFVLPATIFLLIVLYLIFSITFVVLLHHLESLAKQPHQTGRSVSRASSLEPFGKTCCCRCRGCLCSSMSFGGGPPQPQPMPTATINASRKTSIPYSQQQQPQPAQLNHITNPVPYYYGSLGRKTRESRMYLSQLQAMKQNEGVGMTTDVYGGQQRTRLNSGSNVPSQLKPSNKFVNLAADNSFKNPYGTVRRESGGYNYANLDRFNNSTMI